MVKPFCHLLVKTSAIGITYLQIMWKEITLNTAQNYTEQADGKTTVTLTNKACQDVGESFAKAELCRNLPYICRSTGVVSTVGGEWTISFFSSPSSRANVPINWKKTESEDLTEEGTYEGDKEGEAPALLRL